MHIYIYIRSLLSREISRFLNKFFGLGSTKISKINSRNREIKIDFGLFLALFAGPTDTGDPRLVNFFVFSQINK